MWIFQTLVLGFSARSVENATWFNLAATGEAVDMCLDANVVKVSSSFKACHYQ